MCGYGAIPFHYHLITGEWGRFGMVWKEANDTTLALWLEEMTSVFVVTATLWLYGFPATFGQKFPLVSNKFNHAFGFDKHHKSQLRDLWTKIILNRNTNCTWYTCVSYFSYQVIFQTLWCHFLWVAMALLLTWRFLTLLPLCLAGDDGCGPGPYALTPPFDKKHSEDVCRTCVGTGEQCRWCPFSQSCAHPKKWFSGRASDKIERLIYLSDTVCFLSGSLDA